MGSELVVMLSIDPGVTAAVVSRFAMPAFHGDPVDLEFGLPLFKDWNWERSGEGRMCLARQQGSRHTKLHREGSM